MHFNEHVKQQRIKRSAEDQATHHVVQEILKRYAVLRDTYSHDSLQTLLKFECYLRNIEAEGSAKNRRRTNSKLRGGNSMLTLTDGLTS